jgi:putative peptidoglycan lipid II flippase
LIAAGALFSKVAGLGKELAIASRLGAGFELDAFLYAYMFPILIVTVFGGAIVASIVPRYLATEAQESESAARELAGELATLVGIASIALIAIAIPVASLLVPVLARGFESHTQALTIQLIPMMMPLVATSALTSFWSGLLNARRKFAAAAFVPATTPIVVLASLFGGVGGTGAMSLAIGTVVGATIEVTILAYCARISGLELFRMPRMWRPEFGSVLRQFLPAAGSSLLMSGTILIDQSFAANLTAGSLSALSYGTKLAGVSASILIVVVSTLALPAFSRLAAANDYPKLRRSFVTACVLVLVITLPVAATLSFGARPIIELLFMRGNFTSDDVNLAASVQQFHAWHLPMYVLGIVAVRALAAIFETWMMIVGSIANLAVDVLVNITMVPQLGLSAIGLAPTLMYATSTLILCAAFLFQIRRRIARGVSQQT